MDFRSGNRSGRLAAAALAIALAIPAGVGAQALPGPPPGTTQVPQPAQGGVNWQGAGYGAAALFGNLLYIPAKLVYAVTGGIVGGGSYLVTGGNKQVSDTIWRSSLGGDYVLTPDMIQGKEPVYFSGPNQVSPPTSTTPGGSNGPVSSAATSGTPMASAGSPGGGAASSSYSGSSAGGAAPGSISSAPIDSGSGPVASSPGAAAPPLPGTKVE